MLTHGWLMSYPLLSVNSIHVVRSVFLRGCKHRARYISWPEVVRNQGVDCSVSQGSFFCFSFVFRVYVVFCFLVFGCQYQCN